MKSQILLLVAIIAAAVLQCSAISLKAEAVAFPPVLFTFNATACEECKCACRTKFDRLHLLERKACRSSCDKQDICVHYEPVEDKPDPLTLVTVNPILAAATSKAIADGVLNSTQIAAASGNCTDALLKLIAPPTPEFVGAEEKPNDPIAFFAKLQEYIQWKTAQDAPKNFTAPEFKEDTNTVVTAPVVCLECIRATMAPQEHVLAHVVDRVENITVPSTPVVNVTKPEEPVKVEQPAAPAVPVVPTPTVTVPVVPVVEAPAGSDLPPL